MSRLEALDARSWEAFLAAPVAVLMLGKSDCEACAAWSAELEELLDDGAEFPEVRFGKILLDRPGLASFKRANPGVAEVDVLPFNVIYVKGERVKTFAGSGAERLRKRLRRVLEPGS